MILMLNCVMVVEFVMFVVLLGVLVVIYYVL